MSDTSTGVDVSSGGGEAQGDTPKPKCKICCACPETRKPRDECTMMYGEEKCAAQIEAHKACLRAEGFNV